MKTKREIEERIEELEQKMNRACIAEANMAEHKRDDLIDILFSTNWNLQLADCDHVF